MGTSKKMKVVVALLTTVLLAHQVLVSGLAAHHGRDEDFATTLKLAKQLEQEVASTLEEDPVTDCDLYCAAIKLNTINWHFAEVTLDELLKHVTLEVAKHIVTHTVSATAGA